MQMYDILLIMPYFRHSGPYLSICKALSPICSIGVMPLPLDTQQQSKHRYSNELFFRLLEKFGASIVDQGDIHCHVALYPQFPYTEQQTAALNARVHARRKIGMLTLAWAGLHDAFIERFDLEILYAMQRRFMDFLLRYRGRCDLYDKCDIIEVGLPYGKHPVFDEVQAEYFLAMPTPFSFPQESDKQLFLATLISLFSQFEADDRVIFKPHNATDRDSFSTTRLRLVARRISEWAEKALRAVRMDCREPGLLVPVWHKLAQLKTSVLYETIMERVVPLEQLTPYHNLPYEAFLPGISKGVIGGLSNTIWAALYFKLPFYNAVDIHRQDRTPGRTLYKKDPSQLLDLNLQFFGVPYCGGRLQFDPVHFEIVEASTRAGDIVLQLSRELSIV